MNLSRDCFRDVTRFVVVMLAWQSIISTGYGQDQAIQSVTATRTTAPLSSLGRKPNTSATAKPALASKIQPLGQIPDFRSVISVGRSLSALTAASVTNNMLTITYSVFNLRGDPVSGVLLTTTLQSGVTFQSAVPMPDRNGQQLAFSLGSLPPLGSATAQLTVTLANSSITQIDNGATGYAYWNGYPTQAQAIAAVLRTTPVNTSLLPSTINANLNDTYITSEAAALGNDPNRIFQFVRDQVGYESYPGALRGARGTLWSMAGNSLDKASLLVALLRASGIPAQYATGTLALAKQQQLILSMFPAQTQLTGYVANGATLSDPANDPKLQSEAATHYWVQFDSGNGTLVNADPDFAGATVGQTFTSVQSTFIDVPSNLNQMVTVKVNVELTQAGLFGSFQATSTPLTQAFTTAELVGHPLTLGHLVQSQAEGFVLSATTNTYTPYLIVGQDNLDPGDDPTILGQPYQEVLTNFPFGSQVLTGVFLEMDTSDPSGNTTTNVHTILDRFGYAARQGLATANVSLPAGGGAAFTPVDSWTVNVESSLIDPNSTAQLVQRDANLQAEIQTLQPQLNLNSTAPADIVIQQQFVQLATQRTETATQLLNAGFSNIAAQLQDQIALGTIVKAYFGSPRLIIASAQAVASGQTGSLNIGLDLRKDDIRALVFPGQDVHASVEFNFFRGVTESSAESTETQQLASSAPPGVISTTVSTVEVFAAAESQNISMLVLTSANAGLLNTAGFSADADARIAGALQAGKTVIVPSRPVTVNGQATTAWYEVDPVTGVTVDTGEDGNHQGLVEFAAKNATAILLAYIFVNILTFIVGLKTPSVADAQCGGLTGVARTRCVANWTNAGNAALLVLGIIATILCGLLVLTNGEIALGAGLINGTLCSGANGYAGFVGTGVGGFSSSARPAGTQVGAANTSPVLTPPLAFSSHALTSNASDPPVSGLRGGQVATPFQIPGQAQQVLQMPVTTSAGSVSGQLQAASLRATNQIAASWSSTATSGFEIATLSAPNATIKNSSNQIVGTGSAELLLTSSAPAAISGSVNYSVNGTGDLSFYGPATSAIGASGNWTSYSATLTGAPSVQIATNALTLNGSLLPQDTYTITASSLSVGGVGTSTTPNFAGSASMTVTAGSLYVGPGSGTFTSGGTSLSPTNGITLDGFSGTISVTGNGSTDSATINGSAANLLVVTPSPASFTTNENNPVTFSTALATSLADTYSITAEALPGWTVNMDTTGNVTATPAPGTQSGTFPIFVTATSQTDANLVAQAAVLITITGTPPGVTLSIAPDTVFTVPVSGAQLPSAFRATIQNTGPAADTFNVTFSNAAGFTVVDSATSFVIPPGSVAIDGIYLTPAGQLPAPGTQVNFTVTVTSATNSSIAASQPLSFTVPAVQALTLSPNPSSFSTTPGTAVMSTLTLQSAGNVPVTATLLSVTDHNLTLSGLSPSVTLGVGQSTTQNLTITPGANAPLTQPLPVAITAAFGSAGTASGSLAVQVNSVQALAAATGATNAAALGRTDIAATLSGLSGAINLALSSCSPAAQAEVVAYINNLIQEMNAPFLANFASQLQSAESAIAAATCANIGAALTQLSAILANLATALNSPAAFPFSLALQPNSAVAQPGAASSFLVSLQNNSTTTNTYSLSLGSLPSGVTGSLSGSSVTLAPGASNSGSVVSITPSTGSAFQFSVSASINGVSGSAQAALGTITARNTFLAVQDVTATPGFTQSGGSIDVVTHIANVVNQNKTVQVTLVVNNSSNQQVLGPFTQTVPLSVTSLLTTVDFGQIATTGVPNGNYTLAVSVIDPATSMVMPGGTGTGSLLIGSPVSATLKVSPTTIAPGNATVTTTLNVANTNGGSGGGAPFSLIGSVATPSTAESVAINGTTVYTCDNNEVTVINAANPSNPTIAGSAFAGAINNANDIYCSIQRGDLVMLADTGNSGFGNTPSFLAFDLTNPLSPSLIASTTVDKRFFGPPYYQGNTAFFGTDVILLSGSTITAQGGDFVSLDVTNFSAPAVLGTVEQPQSQGPVYGGSFNVFGVTPFSTTLAYAAASTSTGGNTQTGTGQLWAINTSNPSAMSIVSQVDVPGTIQLFSPLVQNNTAVAIADTGGWRNPDVSVDAFLGNIVIAVFDLTNPQTPQLVANVSTSFLPSPTFGRGAAVIGPNLFLYAGVMDGSNNQYLMLVDTTTPQNPAITTYLIPAAINWMTAVGTLLYAPTSSGLQIYSIPGTTGAIQYNATVQVPNTGKVIYNPASFSVHPTITPGGSFDTLTWTNPGVNTITWTSAVTGIAPADVLPDALGGTVNFTVPLGSGTITLPQVDINSGQILGLAPGTQTSAPGALDSYTLIVNNPTNASITYNLAVTGVNPAWVGLQSSVTVAANGSANVPLTMHSAIADIASTYNFTVTATSGGSSGSVQGTLILTGQGSIGAVGSSTALGVSTLLTPTQQTGGQATAATFTVQITNAGNVADSYVLSASTPAGVTATFDQTSFTIPPGLSNFQQTLVHVTAAQGIIAGAKNFTVTATSQTNNAVQGSANGTLNLVGQGVTVSLSAPTVAPGGSLQFTVTNKGQATDTFNLALGGPAAVVSTLALPSVTLSQNQATNVLISIGSAPFAVMGNLGLVASATSATNSAVSAAAQANIVVPSSKSVSAAFAPQRTGLQSPGPATLLLQIGNTGTTDDSYVASIVSTSGPITASLVDITGQPVQTTSVFLLPGVSQGQLTVPVVLTGSGADGTVTVKITSQSNSSITATAIGAVGLGTSIPVAVPGKNRNAKTGVFTSLDGGQSYDPLAARLTYAWTVMSKPAGSVMTLNGATTPQPFFLPDVNGAYTLRLIVNNGSANSAAQTVTITALSASIPPNANAGMAANAQRGSPVTLNGSASNDPSGANLALTYVWTVQSVPSGSALAGSHLAGSATPVFTPDADGAFVIALQVTDANGSSNDTVTITAADPNVTPNANAGPNRRILLNSPITVDGSLSYDPDKGPQSLSDQWRFVSSSLSDAALQNASGAMTAFSPTAPGFYVLRLDVSDGAASSFSETTVMAAHFCDANADGLINQADFDLMTALIGTATQANDPLDVNGDGLITPADIAQCKGAPAPVALPSLYVTPAFLVFQYTKGEALPAAQTLQISADQNTQFSIPNPSFTWVKLNPQTASTPAAVSVSIDPTGLAAGPYLAQLFPVANGFNSPAPVRIELTVFNAPAFIIVPNAVTFNYTSGGVAPAPQTVEVSASGKNTNFTATVSAGATWLSVNKNAGVTPIPVVITANPAANMAPGTYTGTITFTSSEAGSQTVMVTLNVTPGPPSIDTTRIANAASNVGGPVAPGEILSIGGNGFAVAGTNVQWAAGTLVPFEMGDTQVFFDNIPAPMLLLESNMIETIVPYEVANKPTTVMRVVYFGVSSNSVTIPVIAANPGVFTSDGTGLGQIMALNADGSVNSVTHPATRGSTVTFYVTGEGQTNPAGVDGAITANPAPTPIAPQIQVTIGGSAAKVSAAAEEIGKPAGMLQVTVIVPNDAPTGVLDEVLILIGGGLSQRGATIFVN